MDGLRLIPEPPSIFEIEPNDIVFRDGGGRYNAGTKTLVLFIKQATDKLGCSYKWTFQAKTKTAKSIIEKVRNLSEPGRFLRKNEMLNFWVEVDYEEASSRIIDLITASLNGPREIPMKTSLNTTRPNITEFEDVPMVGDNIFHYIAERYQIDTQEVQRIKKMRDQTIQSNSDELFLKSNIRSEYLESKSCSNNGSYQTVWKSFRSWLNQAHPDEAHYFSPCSASSLHQCAPWVTQSFAKKFLEQRTPTKTSRGLYISALNFVLKRQHEMGHHILGSSCPPLELLSRKNTPCGTTSRLTSHSTTSSHNKKSTRKIKSEQDELLLDNEDYYVGNDIKSYILARYEKILSSRQIDQVKESGYTPPSSRLASIRQRYLSCQSCGRNGNYYRLWIRFKAWLTKNHPSRSNLFSPCSGSSLDNCAPWTTVELGYEFVSSVLIAEGVEIDQKGKTTVAAIYIAGMNFLLKNQYEVALEVLGKHCPSRETLSLKQMRINCADKAKNAHLSSILETLPV